VDEYWNAEASGGLPNDIELGIVQLQSGSVRFARAQSEALADLTDAHGTRRDVRLELRRDARARARPNVPEVQRGEEDEPVFVTRRANGFDLTR